MYKLFYYPRNASWAPHMLLAEMALDYELILVDRKSQAQKAPEYLKLNPTGRIPTLVVNGQAIYESAAICLFLCEQHPQYGLIPPAATLERAKFYQWLFYLNASLQPELMVYFYPERHTQSSANLAEIKVAQEQRIISMLRHIDEQLKGRRYLLGDQPSACDFILFMLCHWADDFSVAPLSLPHLGAHLRFMAQRDSVQKVCALEGTDLTAYALVSPIVAEF